MKIQQHAHFLAGEATYEKDGTFAVRHAGITEVNASAWPARAKFVIVTRLELDVEAAAQLHHMAVRLWHETTGEITSWRQPIAAKVVDVSRPIFVNTLGTVEFIVPMEGKIGIAAGIDDLQLPILYVLARTVPGAGTASPPLLRVLPPFQPHGPGKRGRKRRG